MICNDENSHPRWHQEMLGNQSLPASNRMKTDPSPSTAMNDRVKDKSIGGKSTDGNRKRRVIEDLEEMSDSQQSSSRMHHNRQTSDLNQFQKQRHASECIQEKRHLQSVQHSVESRSIQDSTFENNSVQSIELNKETQIESSEDPCVAKTQTCPIQSLHS
jgi:hypothetical protein